MDLIERQPGQSNRHPWEIARAAFFLRLLERAEALRGGRDWLDIGSGDAWFAERLRAVMPRESTLTCWDVNYSEEDLATAPADIAFVSARPHGRYDRILLLDVIEHVADDAAFLAGVVGDLAADGGLVLVSVPAYPRLFGAHDRLLRHERRYTPAIARQLLGGSGLEIVEEGGLFASLVPVRAAQTLAEKAGFAQKSSEGAGGWSGGMRATRLVAGALGVDARIGLWLAGHGVRAPGLSYWALCRAGGIA